MLGEGNGELCLAGMEFQFYKMKRDLEMGGGNGYTTVSMYLISLEQCTSNS